MNNISSFHSVIFTELRQLIIVVNDQRQNFTNDKFYVNNILQYYRHKFTNDTI